MSDMVADVALSTGSALSNLRRPFKLFLVRYVAAKRRWLHRMTNLSNEIFYSANTLIIQRLFIKDRLVGIRLE